MIKHKNKKQNRQAGDWKSQLTDIIKNKVRQALIKIIISNKLQKSILAIKIKRQVYDNNNRNIQ